MTEVLSQAEIDEILKAAEAYNGVQGNSGSGELSQAEIDVLLRTPGDYDFGKLDERRINDLLCLRARMNPQNRDKIKIHDFLRPPQFTGEEIAAFKLIHEDFGKRFCESLSTFLKCKVKFNNVLVNELLYEEFTRSIPNPAWLEVTELLSLGEILVEFHPDLPLAAADITFGGNGDFGNGMEKFDLWEFRVSRIEERVFDDVKAECFFPSLDAAWKKFGEIKGVPIRREKDPYFNWIVHPGDMFMAVQVSYEIIGARKEDFINICYPRETLSPVRKRLNTRFWYYGTETETKPARKTLPGEILDKLTVPLSVELGRTDFPLNGIKMMEEGNILQLDRFFNEEVDVFANGIRIARGEVLVIDNKFGIKITRLEGDKNG